MAMNGREGVLPVFSSEEAAERFLASRVSGDGWRVRAFSGGEVISLLFAFGESIRWVLPDPHHPGVSAPTSRNEFVELLSG